MQSNKIKPYIIIVFPFSPTYVNAFNNDLLHLKTKRDYMTQKRLRIQKQLG